MLVLVHEGERMISGDRFPPQRTRGWAQILSIENPAEIGTDGIAFEDNALMTWRDVWIRCDHFP